MTGHIPNLHLMGSISGLKHSRPSASHVLCVLDPKDTVSCFLLFLCKISYQWKCLMKN